MTRAFDAIVIGAGQAGPSMAARLAAAGRRVAIIERHLVGGACVNTGCTPTKAMVASAYAAHLARRAGDYGIETGPVSIDMAAVKARKDAIAGNSRRNNEVWLEGLHGVTLIRGHARFVGPHEVEVAGETLSAPQIFLNVGGRAATPAMPGLDTIPYLTNSSLLDLDVVPRSLVVIGGSYIGLEFAQIFRRLGAQVTVVEMGPRIVAREDEETSDAIRAFLEDEGVRFRLNAECISFEKRGDDIAAGVSCTSGAPVEIGSHVLLAVGRRPNTDDLGLEAAGVALDQRGYVVVDDQLRTSVDGIWALGDCNGRGAFTHTAYNDFEIVAANLLDGDDRRVGDRFPVYALYTDPPLGRIGMTEAQARAAGIPYKTATRPMTRVGRAVEKGETKGFMKAVVDARTDLILGAAVLGVGGDEAVHGLLYAMQGSVTADAIRRTTPIHPTVAELFPTLMGNLRLAGR
ncbi:FAD-containing oxidoreductase [Chelatococcus sambhunathii]|uniref:FAD-containing oxidoreductase n=1 Tax=Chelatococcus sambhunathii TaxID=363953 RepID=A0ABU1DCY0_9HYPH|nr:FAD-containing oxidoreductase [Chelatococcus sambhunathii]MDR4305927.1 FAD-containing oxidoreductase [Chelatococcus sambhunathii]